jgi:AcrR family transcriptional regulator
MPKVNADYLRDRRDAIVSAATKLFAARGYAGTTMRMIATQAGGSLGAISNYFASKDSIIEASSQLVADHYLLGSRLDLEPNESAVEYLSRLCRAAEQDIDDGVDYSRISIVTWGETMTSDEIRVTMTDVFHEVQVKIAQQLSILQEQGQLPADLDPEAASVLIHAVVNGYMLHAQLLGKQPSTPLGDVLGALVSPGLGK